MGRRRRRRKYNEFLEDYEVVEERDDRQAARKATTERDIVRIANRSEGLVSSEIRERQLVMFTSDGQTIDRSRVKREVSLLEDEIKTTRFEGQDRANEEIDSVSKNYRLSRKKAENLRNREYSARATALLSTARAGGVRLSPYQTGILNSLSSGNYTDTVFGKEDESGRRRYERGTYYNQMGFNREATTYRDSAQRARAREKADNLREYVGTTRSAQGATVNPFAKKTTSKPRNDTDFASIQF